MLIETAAKFIKEAVDLCVQMRKELTEKQTEIEREIDSLDNMDNTITPESIQKLRSIYADEREIYSRKIKRLNELLISLETLIDDVKSNKIGNSALRLLDLILRDITSVRARGDKDLPEPEKFFPSLNSALGALKSSVQIK